MAILGKKYLIQKSFRLDSRIAEDLETLSKILERPQNDLANIAIESLLEENKTWFSLNIIVDHMYDYLINGAEKATFKMQGLTVNLKYDNETDTTDMYVKVRDENGELLDEFDNRFSDFGDLEKSLRDLVRYLDLEAQEVKDYLNHRIDYK